MALSGLVIPLVSIRLLSPCRFCSIKPLDSSYLPVFGLTVFCEAVTDRLVSAFIFTIIPSISIRDAG